MGAGTKKQLAASPASATKAGTAPSRTAPLFAACVLAGALAVPAAAAPASRPDHPPAFASAMPTAHAGAATVLRAAEPCNDADPTEIALNDVYEVRWQGDDCRVVVRARMPVEFTADERDVARLSGEGEVTVESHEGADSRVLEIRPGAGGAPAWSWRVDGTPRPAGDEAHALLRRVLPGLFRAGFAAAERSRAILASRGPEGLLDEAGRLHSGAARALFLDAWFGAPVAHRALDRAIEAARGIDVSVQKAEMLLRISRDPAFHPGLLPALLNAAATIQSETALAGLLAQLAAEHRLSPEARDAYFQAGGRLRSSAALGQALGALLRPGEVDDALLARVIEAAAAIPASEARADLLVRAAQGWPLHGAVREAYLKTAAAIPATAARTRALEALAAQEAR